MNKLKQMDIELLASYIRQDHHIGVLTHLAEDIGLLGLQKPMYRELSFSALKDWLKHPHPLVREGAVIGLSHLAVVVPEALQLLQEAETAEQHAVVKSVITDALASFN